MPGSVCDRLGGLMGVIRCRNVGTDGEILVDSRLGGEVSDGEAEGCLVWPRAKGLPKYDHDRAWNASFRPTSNRYMLCGCPARPSPFNPCSLTSVHTSPDPAGKLWTVPRMANYLHRRVVEPLGFDRKGNACRRVDALDRSIRLYSMAVNPGHVQVLVRVSLTELPEAVRPFRRDSLWAPLERDDRKRYQRPPAADPFPPDLFADITGPGVEFLTHAEGRNEFIEWAQEIYDGDQHRGWWGRFRPVLPQGSSPLQAAAFAAALMRDRDRTAELAARAVGATADADEVARFEAELANVLGEIGGDLTDR